MSQVQPCAGQHQGWSAVRHGKRLELEHAVKEWGEAVEARERAEEIARESCANARRVIEAVELAAKS